MTFLQGIVRDLREKRLWPVALALVAALVAVPALLAKPAPAPSVAALPQAGPGSGAASPATAVPAVSVQSSPGHSSLNGRRRDPFTQQRLRTSKASGSNVSSKGSGSSGAGTTTAGGAKSSSTGNSTGGSSTSASGAGSTLRASFPTVRPKPAPPGLTSDESYGVAFSITNSAGGLDTSDPLERLSVVPSERQALLVELGVLQGGHRVLFAVEPGTVISGPGACTPGPVDCEILSLAPGQVEQLSIPSTDGPPRVAMFAVTAITAERHSSVGAADRDRGLASAAGLRLLTDSPLSALSLFRYEPSLGALVDLRNLIVGGN